MSKPIEVVVMNWRRPANVRAIVDALLLQNDVCRVTLIEAAPNSEYALDAQTLARSDRYFVFSRNFGSVNRYIPSLSFSAEYTYFHDDDMLPGPKSISYLLDCAQRNSDFAVLGQFGRIVTKEGGYAGKVIRRVPHRFVAVDSIVRAYFVKTDYLSFLPLVAKKLKLSIAHCEDDLLLSTALTMESGFPCLLTPKAIRETSICYRELPCNHALSGRSDHYARRQAFIDAVIALGWRPRFEIDTGRTEVPSGSVEGTPGSLEIDFVI